MGLRHHPQCKACNSPRREEIDRRLLAGESAREVARWLEVEGEPIPHQALTNHRKAHLDILAEVKERLDLRASEEVFEAAVTKTLGEIETLDQVASIALEVAQQLKPLAASGQIKMASAVVFNGALKEAREAARVKSEILNGKKVNLDASVSGLSELYNALSAPPEADQGGGEGSPPSVEG